MIKFNFSIRFVFLSFLFLHIAAMGYGNTREDCEQLLTLSREQRAERNYAQALENLFNAKIIAEDKKWNDLKIKILNLIGSIYSDILDHNKAMDYYLKGYHLALKESDELGKLVFLNNIGVLYSEVKDYEKSHEYIKQAYTIAKQLNDTLRIGRLATNLATIARENNNPDLAEKYLAVSFNFLPKNPNDLGYFFAQSVKVENLYQRADYENAEKLALEIYHWKDNIKDDDVKSQFLLTFAKIYYQKKDFQKAIFYAREALNANPKLTIKVEIYDYLAKIYQEKQSFGLSIQYKDSVILLSDSLSRLNDINQRANDQIRFDLLHLENKFTANKEKQRIERILFVCIIVFFFVFLLVSLWIFRMLSVKNRQKKIMAENRQKIAELELKEEKHSQILLKQQVKENEERLSKEIETKNRELASKVLFQSNRNGLIEEIITHLSSILHAQGKNGTLGLTIQQLKRQLKESNEWEGFLVYFEQINPEFLSALKKKHSDLTADEVRFLSYIYMGLSSKEIAQLSSITFAHYRKKKQRIATKLEVDTRALYHYLVNEVGE